MILINKLMNVNMYVGTLCWNWWAKLQTKQKIYILNRNAQNLQFVLYN